MSVLPPLLWQLCDPDAEPGTTYRTGVGFGDLVRALRELTVTEAKRTPVDYIPSGNIALYWSRKRPGQEDKP